MTTTFKYRNGYEFLLIRGDGDDLRLIIEDCGIVCGVTLDQVGRDALRNYLDGLEEEEEIEQTEQLMWDDVEF